MLTATAEASVEQQVRRMVPVAAPPEQRAEIAALFQMLDRVSNAEPQRGECKLIGPAGKAIPVPESVFFLLERVVEVMARGDSITIVPVGKEMTTQQAANMLNMSRQYLVRLLEGGQIPFTKTGRHRRVSVEDVLAFKAKRDRERKGKLDRLAALSQDAGGYADGS